MRAVNSATTPLCQEAREEMIAAMDVFGNPSSLHSAGLEAEKLVRLARERIYRALSIKNPDGYRVIFTASGSEANNQILFGVANAKKYRFTPRIITTDSEHPSVLEPLSVLESRGVEVIRLSTKGGAIDLAELRSAITPATVLVSIMAINNETGAKYDLKSIFTLAKRLNPNVITHTDCVQGFMKMPFSPELISCDAISLSAHKIHGPKGVGALVLSKALITAKKKDGGEGILLRLLNNTPNAVETAVTVNGCRLPLRFGKFEAKTVLFENGQLTECAELLI